MKDIATGPLTRYGGLKVVEAPFCFTKYQEDFNMEKRYYLAYGSNLNVRQMMVRCPSARIIGTATIKDYKLMFKSSDEVQPRMSARISVDASSPSFSKIYLPI